MATSAESCSVQAAGEFQEPEPQLDPLVPLATLQHDFRPNFGNYLTGQCEEGGQQLGVVSVSCHRSAPRRTDRERRHPRHPADSGAPRPLRSSHRRAGATSPNSTRKAQTGRSAPESPPQASPLRFLQRHILCRGPSCARVSQTCLSFTA